MKGLTILLYEWKHFVRSPFKVVALALFAFAGVYGLHNGEALYHEQVSEITKISKKLQEQKEENVSLFDQEKPSPENRPWIDLSIPDWAMWYSKGYYVKTPSPALVYSIGQAEQYGFYKRVAYISSPYDSDMTKEIANPERLQTGTLDFAFALIFLLPLLLIILLYNLKSMEKEQGFLSIIEVQTASKNTWLLSRVIFYVGLTYLVIIGLLLYGASLTDVLVSATSAFQQVVFYSLLYLIFWSVIYFLILRNGRSIISNTLKMVGIWIIMVFIIPATVHQWISIEKPANLMTDYIDASRDKQEEIYNRPDSILRIQLKELFPEISGSPIESDSEKSKSALRESITALTNELKKENIALIEEDNKQKNERIKNSYYVNPITFFQNRFNAISKTHYEDYHHYRNEIQSIIDAQLRMMVIDLWNEVKVDKQRFIEYCDLSSNKKTKID